MAGILGCVLGWKMVALDVGLVALINFYLIYDT